MAESITCPKCESVSYHPEDIRQGYCGRCHWWTSDPQLGSPEVMALFEEEEHMRADLVEAAARSRQWRPWRWFFGKRTLKEDELMSLEPTDQTCDGCGAVIYVGQHYLRGVVLVDTAGMERHVFDVPEPVATGIFCLPQCVAIGTLRQLIDSEIVQDVFNGNH